MLKSAGLSQYDVVGGGGVARLSNRAAGLIPAIRNLTNRVSESPFAETWASQVETTLERTNVLGAALDRVQLEQPFAAAEAGRGSVVAKSLEQVALLIRANAESLHNDRDAFFVQQGSMDIHSDAVGGLAASMAVVDAALASFEAEMKLQGMWDNIAIVQASEFGRTLTSNGDGTDHAWGGNYFMAGGSVKGGQIVGQYPDNLGEDGATNIGRGRLVPTTSWESIWNAVGGWFGVSDGGMDIVLPNKRNFPDIFGTDELFVSNS